jgi:serine/threonine-protein kinase HipA
MERSGTVLFNGRPAGKVWQDENGYGFQYFLEWLVDENATPVSLTLPLQEEAYLSNTMIPFFDGLIPEGWLLNIAISNWKLNQRDRMSLLLTVCRDCIGAVSVEGLD